MSGMDYLYFKSVDCLNPKGEFWNRLKRALGLSKNVSEPAKNDLGNSPSTFNHQSSVLLDS